MRIAAIHAVLLSLLLWAGSARADQQGFSVLWNVNGALPLQSGTAPVSRNFVLFNFSDIGEYPAAGPHMIERAPEGREAFIQRHISKIAAGVASRIPNPNWDGYAAIDWEIWMPYWTGHEDTASNLGIEANDRDFITDWREHVRATRSAQLAGKTPAQQEVIFRETWLDITREFYLRTLQECKRLRPQTKWGFYHLPLSPYFAWMGGDPLFETQLQDLRRAHEELAPVLDASGALFPSLYIFFEGVPSQPELESPSESRDRQPQVPSLQCRGGGAARQREAGRPIRYVSIPRQRTGASLQVAEPRRPHGLIAGTPRLRRERRRPLGLDAKPQRPHAVAIALGRGGDPGHSQCSRHHDVSSWFGRFHATGWRWIRHGGGAIIFG
jgi:hypothetical protein